MAEAKLFFNDCQYEKSLEVLKDCFNLKPTDKLKTKMEMLEKFIDNNENSSQPSANDIVFIKEKIYLDRKTFGKLYDYQQEGIKWLSNLHYSSIGGILADDMGLGKTVQISTFILAISNAIPKASFLIVMPVSLVPVWTKELQKWAPSLFCFTYQGASSKASVNKMLKKVQDDGGIVLTTYGSITSNAVTFRHHLRKCPELLRLNKTAENSIYGPQFQYTYTILDEGHKIKNPAAKCTKALLSINSTKRLVLTGTAVQNNLTELWSLFNYTHCGKLLGTQATFKREYSNAIEHGRTKDANSHEQHYGKLVAESLRKLINPYFLRRTKNEVLGKDSSQLEKMSRKDEIVIWLYLTDVQEKIYRDFLSSDEVKYILMGERKSPLVSLTILKKLCDHPRLLTRDQCEELELETDCFDIEKNILNPGQIMRESNKIRFTVFLMDHLLQNNHKVLVFSLSLKLLNMLQIVLENLNEKKIDKYGPDAQIHRICRLDGRIKTTEERGNLVDVFENSDAYTSMFLTTQVGGVGLTLISADRVIILDPSWNPAVDAQAVDRAYRIGQKKDVVVYRLITCSTVEEKIYRRQVFKQSIIRQTTGGTAKEDLNSYRYFSNHEIRDLFTLDPDVRQSPTQTQLVTLHADQLKEKPESSVFEEHLEMLKENFESIMFGISHHDLLFTKAEKFDEIQNPEALNQARLMAYQSEQKIMRENISGNPQDRNQPHLSSSGNPKLNLPLNSHVFKPNELQNRQAFKINQPQNKPAKNLKDYLMAQRQILPKAPPVNDRFHLRSPNTTQHEFSTPKTFKKVDIRPTPQDMKYSSSKNTTSPVNSDASDLIEISSDEGDSNHVKREASPEISMFEKSSELQEAKNEDYILNSDYESPEKPISQNKDVVETSPTDEVINLSEMSIHPIEKSAPKIYLSSSEDDNNSKNIQSRVENSEDSQSEGSYVDEMINSESNGSEDENLDYNRIIEKSNDSQFYENKENFSMKENVEEVDPIDIDEAQLSKVINNPQFRKSILANLSYSQDSE